MFQALKNLLGKKEVKLETKNDELEFDDFVGEDEWEDGYAIAEIRKKYPPNWMLVKCYDFTYGTMADMKQWCIDNCVSQYAHVGWDSGCSYTVGVIFESHVDAVLFKLTWNGI